MALEQGCLYRIDGNETWEWLGQSYYADRWLINSHAVLQAISAANGGQNTYYTEPVWSNRPDGFILLPDYPCDSNQGNGGGTVTGGTRPRIVAGAPVRSTNPPNLWQIVSEHRFSAGNLAANQWYLIGGAGALVLLALLLKRRG